MEAGQEYAFRADQSPTVSHFDSREVLNQTTTPIRLPERQGTPVQLTEPDCSHDSITDSILAQRKQRCQEKLPTYSPTPTKSRLDARNKLAQRQRAEKRHQRTTQARGGLEKMEQFVMKGEQLDELQRLSLQAQENALTADLAQLLEQEVQEDLEDDELIQYFDRRDQLDQELDTVLSELSIS